MVIVIVEMVPKTWTGIIFMWRVWQRPAFIESCPKLPLKSFGSAPKPGAKKYYWWRQSNIYLFRCDWYSTKIVCRSWMCQDLNMSIFTLGRLKNHKITHLYPHFTMCMSRTRLQLNINQFFLNFHVCSNYSLWGMNQSMSQICVIKLRISFLRQTGVELNSIDSMQFNRL